MDHCKPRLLRRAQSRWGFQRGEAAALPFGRTRGFKPRVRYNLIRKSKIKNLKSKIGNRTSAPRQARGTSTLRRTQGRPEEDRRAKCGEQGRTTASLALPSRFEVKALRGPSHQAAADG